MHTKSRTARIILLLLASSAASSVLVVSATPTSGEPVSGKTLQQTLSPPPKTSVSVSTSIVQSSPTQQQANRFLNENSNLQSGHSVTPLHNLGEPVKLLLPAREYHYLQPQSGINYVAAPVNEFGRILDGSVPFPQAQLVHAPMWHYATQQSNMANGIRSRGATSFSRRVDESGQENEIVVKQTQADQTRQQQRATKCPSKGLGNVLKRAKNLLTGGFASIEERATTGNLVLGSSVLAAIIPLVALLVPDGLSLGGLLAAAAASNGENNGGKRATSYGGALQGRVESVIGWVERSIGHLPNFPRLHPQECVKRSICEAHNDPTKYGALGFTLRLMFPATNSSNVDEMDYRVSNKYRRAASYGLDTRLDSNGTNETACKEKYEDCLVSLLDVAQNLVDFFLRAKE